MFRELGGVSNQVKEALPYSSSLTVVSIFLETFGASSGMSAKLLWICLGCVRCCGCAVDYFRVKARFVKVVAVYLDQLANLTAVIHRPLAIQNKVDGLGGLAPDESVVEVGPCTEREIGKPV